VETERLRGAHSSRLATGEYPSYATSLRAARVARLLSIRELAREAAVAPSTVFLIEAGRATPRPRVMRRLSAVLGVSPHDVLEFREAMMAARTPAPSL
jgi:ribosome-binding protein aMBF1 (putative translation factor)